MARPNARPAIRYLLDGEVRTVPDAAPTRTVLQHLREDLGRTGTKEGCAEGDCGACTVVLAELDGRKVRYRAVNACIRFLPTLDGRALVTVESLKDRATGALHPVQAAIAHGHGSQCGFCTPGFVMAARGMLRENPDPTLEEVKEGLSGHICRCGCYAGIAQAVLHAAEKSGGKGGAR
jgi:xanthine dehydrogenase small subunit